MRLFLVRASKKNLGWPSPFLPRGRHAEGRGGTRSTGAGCMYECLCESMDAGIDVKMCGWIDAQMCTRRTVVRRVSEREIVVLTRMVSRPSRGL